MKTHSLLYRRCITAFYLATVCLFVYLYTPWYILATCVAGVTSVIAYEWGQLGGWRISWGYPLVALLVCVVTTLTTELHYLLAISVISAAATDTSAYIVGKLLGTMPLAPHVSPGKTWQGLAGSLFFGGAATYGIWAYYHPEHIAVHIIPALFMPLAGCCGDLHVSWAKRRARVKDTGALLQSHGGLLDRCDSLLYIHVITVCYYLLLERIA